jgi:hypothetical protein
VYENGGEVLTRHGHDRRDESKEPVVLGMAPPYNIHSADVVQQSKIQQASSLVPFYIPHQIIYTFAYTSAKIANET